jgi:hypothetical protein
MAGIKHPHFVAMLAQGREGLDPKRRKSHDLDAPGVMGRAI